MILNISGSYANADNYNKQKDVLGASFGCDGQ